MRVYGVLVGPAGWIMLCFCIKESYTIDSRCSITFSFAQVIPSNVVNARRHNVEDLPMFYSKQTVVF